MVTSIIDELDKIYGEMVPVSRSRGKVNDYLGMMFDFSNAGQIKMTIYYYIHDLIESKPPRYMNESTPAPENLYTVRNQHDDT